MSKLYEQPAAQNIELIRQLAPLMFPARLTDTYGLATSASSTAANSSNSNNSNNSNPSNNNGKMKRIASKDKQIWQNNYYKGLLRFLNENSSSMKDEVLEKFILENVLNQKMKRKYF